MPLIARPSTPWEPPMIEHDRLTKHCATDVDTPLARRVPFSPIQRQVKEEDMSIDINALDPDVRGAERVDQLLNAVVWGEPDPVDSAEDKENGTEDESFSTVPWGDIYDGASDDVIDLDHYAQRICRMTSDVRERITGQWSDRGFRNRVIIADLYDISMVERDFGKVLRRMRRKMGQLAPNAPTKAAYNVRQTTSFEPETLI